MVRRTRTAHRRATTRRSFSRRAARGGSQWNREEIAFMRKYYRNHATAWVARQLGRTVYSVRYKASDLNIRKANPSVWRISTDTPTRSSRRRSSTWRKRYGSPANRATRRSRTRRNYKRRSYRKW